MAGYLAIGLGAVGAAYKLYQSYTQSPKEEVREAPTPEQTTAKIKQYNEKTYKNYQSKLQPVLDTLKGRLKAIDPQLVGGNRVGWFFPNFFAWISRCWNKALVKDLKPKYDALLAETKKTCPAENGMKSWANATPIAITSALEKGPKALIAKLKADYNNAMKNPEILPEVRAEKPAPQTIEDLHTITNHIKQTHPLFTNAEIIQTVRPIGGLPCIKILANDSTGNHPFQVSVGQEISLEQAKARLIELDCSFLSHTLFPQDPQAYIFMLESGAHELVYSSKKQGMLVGGIEEGGAKLFEEATFTSSERIQYTIQGKKILFEPDCIQIDIPNAATTVSTNLRSLTIHQSTIEIELEGRNFTSKLALQVEGNKKVINKQKFIKTFQNLKWAATK